MELNFWNSDLPVFSDVPCDYIKLYDFKNIHNFENELTDLIFEKDSLKENEDKNIEVEHQYINFEMLIISEKIRAIEKGNSAHNLEFNDIYYSTLMIDQEETNQEFYNKETIQKIIDFQYGTTRVMLSYMLYVYLIGFCLPFCLMIGFDFESYNETRIGGLCLLT